MMDKMTTDMCKEGSGRLGYAWVLVEVNAEKSIWRKMRLTMLMPWKNDRQKELNKKVSDPISKDGDKSNGNSNKDQGNADGSSNGVERSADLNTKKKMDNFESISPPSLEKIWNAGPKKIVEMRSANKYAVLSEENNNVEFDGNVCKDDRLIVDRYILGKAKLPPEEMIKWTYDMKLYYIYRWEAVNREYARSDLVGMESKFWLRGSSGKTADMIEFNDAINSLEVDDICSSGFQFTWTKSLKNTQCKFLKKQDIIFINDEFIQKFHEAHGVFLLYMVSDYSPAVLYIKNGIPKKKSSFRFSNIVADKEEFIDVVKNV
ncbi:hypothetical protein Tco_0788892 [Tanacetum coccineum]